MSLTRSFGTSVLNFAPAFGEAGKAACRVNGWARRRVCLRGYGWLLTKCVVTPGAISTSPPCIFNKFSRAPSLGTSWISAHGRAKGCLCTNQQAGGCTCGFLFPFCPSSLQRRHWHVITASFNPARPNVFLAKAHTTGAKGYCMP